MAKDTRVGRGWSTASAVWSSWMTCVVLAMLVSTVGGAFARDVTSRNAKLTSDGTLTRFSIDFSEEVDFEVFTLDNPYRVIVDLPEVEFTLPDAIGNKGSGLVSAFRYGLFAPGKARIVIDVTGPVRIEAARLDQLREGEARQLVVDLVTTDQASFDAEVQKRRDREKLEASLRAPRPVEVTPGMLARRAGRNVIVVDAGHGGIDTGAKSASGTREKDVLLAVALALREELSKRPNYHIVLTRDTDVFIPLRRRVEIARENGAHLFISVHADSLPARYAQSVRGATVYTLSDKGSDALADEFARRENKSDVVAGVEVEEDQDELADILFDLARREAEVRSRSFAEVVLGKLHGKTALNQRPHRSAGFRVLKSREVPAVLIELGYITNRKDESELLSPEWRARVSAAIASSVDAYFGKKFARFPF